MSQTVGNHNYQIYALNSSGVYSSPISVSVNISTCSNSSLTPGLYIPYNDGPLTGSSTYLGKILQFNSISGAINQSFSTPFDFQANGRNSYITQIVGSDSNGNFYTSIGNYIYKYNSLGVFQGQFAVLPSSNSRWNFKTTSNGDIIAVNEGLGSEASTIYKISQSGMVSNYGTFQPGYLGDFKLDSSNNVYLLGGNAAGYRTGKIVKVSPSGTVTEYTLTGDATQISGAAIVNNELYIFSQKSTTPFKYIVRKINNTSNLLELQQDLNNPNNFSYEFFDDNKGNIYLHQVNSPDILKVDLITGATPVFSTNSSFAIQLYKGYPDLDGNIYFTPYTVQGQQPAGGTSYKLLKMSSTGIATTISPDLLLTNKTWGNGSSLYMPTF